MNIPFDSQIVIALFVLSILGWWVKLVVRKGPSTIREFLAVCGVAVLLTLVTGYPLAPIPIAVALVGLVSERWG